MAENQFKTNKVVLKGLRSLMFDRYAGDNNTQLPVAEKMYLGKDGALMMPALNILSLLVAENTKSVCRQFFGKNVFDRAAFPGAEKGYSWVAPGATPPAAPPRAIRPPR